MEIDMNMWEFIEHNYPRYTSCDSVLLSDILTRHINDEELEQSDIDHILEDKPEGIEPKLWAKYKLMAVDRFLLQRAIEDKIGKELDF